MSTVVLAACWPLQMPPSPKAVLISLADNANDSGECFPSISYICARTCLGKTAVIEAIKYLEAQQLVVADRTNGRHTRYRITVTLDLFGGARPVRQANRSAKRTGSLDEPDRSASRTAPVRQADTNRQEPSGTKEREQARERADSLAEQATAAEPTPTAAGAAALVLRQAGIHASSTHPKLLALLQAGVTLDELRDAADEVRTRAPEKATLPYVLSVVEGRRRDAAAVKNLPDRPPNPAELANQRQHERWLAEQAERDAQRAARAARARAGPETPPQPFVELAKQLGISQ